MTSPEVHAEAWMQAMHDSVAEVVSVALGVENGAPSARRAPLPPGLAGAYLPVFSALGAVQIGVIADAGGCQRLARALLGLSEEEPDLEPSEVRDAVCEIANLVAGGIKRRVPASAGLELGLPLFIEGSVSPADHIEVLACDIELAPMRALTVLYRDARAPGARSPTSPQPPRSRRG